MTVSATVRKAGPFSGNGVTTAFPFAFKVFTTADLALTLTDVFGVITPLTLNSDYSIALNADQDSTPGGTITYPLGGSPLAVGQTLTGVGSLAASQGVDITNGGRFLPQVMENALDKLTILAQQDEEKSDRFLALAGGASTAAAAAATSAGAAAGSAAAAAGSAAGSAASRSAIDNRIYPGTFAADPATRPNGTAIQNGDVYVTTAGTVKVRSAGAWVTPTVNMTDLANQVDPAKGAALIGFAGELLPATFNSLIARDVTQWRRNRTLERTVYGRDTLPLVASKLHVPSLTLADLASTAGLSVHASGGIIATVAGATGTGKITLPSPIDPSKPFRVHMLFELNGDTANNLVLQLGSTGTPPFWSGTKAVTLQANNITATIGGATPFNDIAGVSPVPAGTKFWLSICGDGTYVTTSFIPDIPSASFDADWWEDFPAFQDVWNAINWRPSIVSDVASGAGQFTWGRAGQADQLTQIFFTSTSTSTRFIGVYCNIGELEGPGDRRMGAPMVAMLNNSQDCAGVSAAGPVVLVPPHWGCPGARDFVFQHHPNGNVGSITQSLSGPTALAMYFAGYALGTMSGCQSNADFAGATCSNWGAPTGLQYRKSFLDYFRNAFRFDGKLIHWGLSMGLMNALRYFAQYGEGDAIVGVSGACDLTDSFNNRGFNTIINAAFGAWYVSLASGNTGNTPETSPTLWKRINRDVGPTGRKSLLAPFTWRNLYAAGTAYAQHDIVYRPYSAGIAALSPYDPVLNPKLFAGLPIRLYHGTADGTIPIAQANSFAAAVALYAASVDVVGLAGGGHLDATTWNLLPVLIPGYLDALI